MDSSRDGHVTAADWHQSFEAAGEALKVVCHLSFVLLMGCCCLQKEISHWLHELLISHHGTVIEAFEQMDPGEGVVTVAVSAYTSILVSHPNGGVPQNLKTGLEQMIGVRLQQVPAHEAGVCLSSLTD